MYLFCKPEDRNWYLHIKALKGFPFYADRVITLVIMGVSFLGQRPKNRPILNHSSLLSTISTSVPADAAPSKSSDGTLKELWELPSRQIKNIGARYIYHYSQNFSDLNTVQMYLIMQRKHPCIIMPLVCFPSSQSFIETFLLVDILNKLLLDWNLKALLLETLTPWHIVCLALCYDSVDFSWIQM